jgi:hypothetical protein
MAKGRIHGTEFIHLFSSADIGADFMVWKIMENNGK